VGRPLTLKSLHQCACLSQDQCTAPWSCISRAFHQARLVEAASSAPNIKVPPAKKMVDSRIAEGVVRGSREVIPRAPGAAQPGSPTLHRLVDPGVPRRPLLVPRASYPRFPSLGLPTPAQRADFRRTANPDCGAPCPLVGPRGPPAPRGPRIPEFCPPPTSLVPSPPQRRAAWPLPTPGHDPGAYTLTLRARAQKAGPSPRECP